MQPGVCAAIAEPWQDFEVVPPELLFRPTTAGTRRLDGDLSASLLEDYLVRLAHHEARCRRILGLVARAFLLRRAHQRLGFARLGDYTRERLGLSAREVQELARVANGLGQLPAIAAAFADGVLTWSHVRLLVAVATPETEAAWLERARGRTVRALAALVAEAAPGAVDDEDTIDGEPRAHFRQRCPQTVRRAWRETMELARRVSGEELPTWRAAETVAAEGLTAPEVNLAEVTARDGDVHAACGHVAGDGEDGAGGCGPGCPQTDEALPPQVEALGRDVADLDAFGLDARLRAAVRALQGLDAQAGPLLRLVADLRLHRAFGFPSLAAYVRERLGLSPRKVRALVALERRAARLPVLAEAYRAGRLSWLRALTILPVVRDGVAAAWVTRAREVTVRRLVAEVEWGLEVGRPGTPVAPPPVDATLDLPEGQMCAREGARPDAEIAFVGPASVVGYLRLAVTAFTRPGDPPWRGLARLLAHVRAEWERLPRHRDPVFARDGWRCVVPACSARRNLHDHHIVFRSRGGRNVRDNRVTVCAGHHLHGIHAGRVRARGRAPGAITWELGVRADGPPLIRTRGDRYLTAS